MSQEKNQQLETPVINPYYLCRILPGEGTILLSEFASVTFYEPIYSALLSLIDGEKTLNDIVEQLGDRFDVTHIYYILFALAQKNYVIEKKHLVNNAEDAYWLSQNIAPIVARTKINTPIISLRQFGNVNIDLFKTILTEAGIQIGQQGDIEIVVTDSYLHPDLIDYNQQALQKQRPWLLVKPHGVEPWIGPVFNPGKTACYQCLHYLISRNHRIENFVASKCHAENALVTSMVNYKPHLNIVYNMTLSLLSKFLVNEDKALLTNHLLSLNMHTLALTQHAFSKREHCAACGHVSIINPLTSLSRLQALQAISMTDGGYRTVSPEETIKRYQHLVDPITGIVAQLQPFEDKPLFVYLSGQNHAFPINKLSVLKQSLRNNCAGKGISEAQAKASAICEALERYSGEFQGNEHRITASYTALADKAIHPNACMLFSDQQYQDRDRWNALDSKFTRVCEPFDPERQIEWSPVWSLTSKTTKYLPTQYLYYYYQDQVNPSMYCYPDSNGNAAGNTLEEAILQGFFELAERDAIAMWWYNRLHKPAVLLESFNHPYFSKLQDYYRSKQRDLWVLDLSNDLGIPTFAAISKKSNATEQSIILGFGAHFDVNIAVSRALTEMNQMLISADHMSNEQPQHMDAIFRSWLANAVVEQQTYLTHDQNSSARKMTDYPRLSEGRLLDDLQRCQTIIESKHMELLVLNQTRPEIGLSVVKVLCPGLRHFWARFAPGRLYDVPVQMGWLKKPLHENELNQLPIFF